MRVKTGLYLLGFLGRPILLVSYDRQSLNKLTKGISNAILAMMFWGIAIFLIILVSREVHWITIEFYTFFVGFVLSVFIFWIKRPKYKIEKGIRILLMSVIFEMVAYYFLNQASTYERSGVIGAITGAYAIVAIALSMLVLKEKLTKTHQLGILMTILGLIGVNLYG